MAVDMTPAENAVSLAAEEADERTSADVEAGVPAKPGAWHRHFIASLHEQGWRLTQLPEGHV